jgi:glucose-6-phosphate 1-epimerase
LRNAAGDEAVVSLHGGQVLSWKPVGSGERLYASPLSLPAAGKAVRGGVPVCFPQFSDRGPLPKHGFARTSRWEVVAHGDPGAEVAQATFQLDSRIPPGATGDPFALVLVVRLADGALELQLQAANTGRSAFAFTAALHTYLRVADVRELRLHGLQGLQYEDMVADSLVKQELAPDLHIEAEIDRVYREAGGPVELQGPARPRLRVLQQGFTDVVVWNPGPAKAARLGDMPAEDWTRMLCVEAAVISQPVQLHSGRTWTGVQRLELVRD